MSAIEAELSIDSIAAGGDGVGRTEGLVIFVPRTAPGDRIRASFKTGGRFGRGKIRTITAYAPSRVKPPCPHYTVDRCGGCQLQHMAYDAQLAAKSTIVSDALTRIGGREVQAPMVAPSPEQWRYRRKLTLAMRRRASGWIAGLHPYDDPDAVFDLRDCPITDERVVEVWKAIMAASDFFPNSQRLRGAVRLLGDGASFVLEGPPHWPGWREFLQAVPAISELWYVAAESPRRLLWQRDNREREGATFTQVNIGMATQMHARVIERVMAHAPGSVVDAYAGTGATAAGMAVRGARVTAIEADRDAARICASVLAAPSRAECGLVETLLAAALPADVLVVNPPRTGLHEAIPGIVSASPPRTLIYVSCNPATLARDIKRLPQYRITALESFDMFPQTAHVETLCEMTLA